VPSPDPAPRLHPSPLLETLPRFAVIMAALLAVAALPQSALFAVSRVEVTGAATVPVAEVVARAGLRGGERLFAVDADATRRRLLADPRIRDAEVRLRPPRTVAVAVVERRPVLALALRGGYALLGDDLVTVAVQAHPAELPVVTDRTGARPDARPGVPAGSAAARTALEALPLIPAEMRAEVRRIVVGAGRDITLVLASGLEIRAGGLSGLTERLARVPQALEALRARHIQATAVDLRYAGSMVVTLDTGGDGR
jgi:cell division protein FtsQ